MRVNAVGDSCPLPVIKTKKALSEMDAGQLEVLVDNEIAVQNIRRFAESAGHGFSYKQENGAFLIVIDKKTDAAPTCTEEFSGKTVVVLASDVMGTGDDELGRILMKGFVFALTQLESPPDTVLLYNGGARLSVEGSGVLADLTALENAGTKIMTCGTCLNHFGLADQLRVGEVTNMYAILEKMQSADRIVQP